MRTAQRAGPRVGDDEPRVQRRVRVRGGGNVRPGDVAAPRRRPGASAGGRCSEATRRCQARTSVRDLPDEPLRLGRREDHRRVDDPLVELGLALAEPARRQDAVGVDHGTRRHAGLPTRARAPRRRRRSGRGARPRSPSPRRESPASEKRRPARHTLSPAPPSGRRVAVLAEAARLPVVAPVAPEREADVGARRDHRRRDARRRGRREHGRRQHREKEGSSHASILAGESARVAHEMRRGSRRDRDERRLVHDAGPRPGPGAAAPRRRPARGRPGPRSRPPGRACRRRSSPRPGPGGRRRDRRSPPAPHARGAARRPAGASPDRRHPARAPCARRRRSPPSRSAGPFRG